MERQVKGRLIRSMAGTDGPTSARKAARGRVFLKVGQRGTGKRKQGQSHDARGHGSGRHVAGRLARAISHAISNSRTKIIKSRNEAFDMDTLRK